MALGAALIAPTFAHPDAAPVDRCSTSTAQQHTQTAHSILQAVYARKRWQHRHPLRDRTRAALKLEIGCSEHPADLEKAWKKRKHDFFLYRSYRKVATFPGFHEGDPYLRWLAIPSGIVACETNGYRGKGRWLAHNGSSSAAGPYQILIGRIYPALTPEAKVQNHERAAEIWRDQGPGAWECS